MVTSESTLVSPLSLFSRATVVFEDLRSQYVVEGHSPTLPERRGVFLTDIREVCPVSEAIEL